MCSHAVARRLGCARTPGSHRAAADRAGASLLLGFDEEWRSTGVEHSVGLDAEASAEELARIDDGGMTRSDPERAGALRVAAGRHWWLPVVLAALVVVGSLGSVTSLAVHPSAGAVTGHVDARAQNATRAAQAFADSRVELLEQLVVPYAERPEVQAAVTAGELQRGPTPVTTTLHQVQTSAPGLVARRG